MDNFWNDENTSGGSFWDDDDDMPRMRLTPDEDKGEDGDEEAAAPDLEAEAPLVSPAREEIDRAEMIRRANEKERLKAEQEERQLDAEEAPLREAFEKNRAWMDGMFDVYGKVTDILLGMAAKMEDGEAKDELEEKLWRLKYRLMQGPVRLLVLGASSSGKSTIVNALTGKVVSPEAAQVSTLIPAWVKGVVSEIEEPLCYALRFGGDPAGEFMPRSDYLKEFCHPPEDRNSMPGGVETDEEGNTAPVYYAVRVETASPFLAQSGFTLLDTPGVEQNARETGMAADTAALGAEMLLLAARATTLKKEEQELFKQLLYDEERGMGLCVPKDVFCLFNEQLLDDGDYNLTIRHSFSDLSSGREPEEQIDMENRYYIVDALTERRKGEMYDFLDWSPKGVGLDSYKELNRLMDYEEKACEALEDAPYSPDMRHLLRDLKRRAWEIYADRGRVCGPIEETMFKAAEVLKAYQQEQARKLEEKIRKEIEGMPAEDLTTPELVTLRYELEQLLTAGKDVVEKSGRLNGSCQKLLQEMEHTATTLKNSSDTQVSAYTNNLSGEIVLESDKLKSGDFSRSLFSVNDWFIKHCDAWQKRIKNGEVEKGCGCDGRDEFIKQYERILKLHDEIRLLVDEYAETASVLEISDVPSVVKGWKSDFNQLVGSQLAKAGEIEAKARSLVDFARNQIQSIRRKRPSGGDSLLGSIGVGLWDIWNGDGSFEIRQEARKRLNAALKKELEAYSEVVRGQRTMIEARLNSVRADIDAWSEALKLVLRQKGRQVEAQEEAYRKVLCEEALRESIEPIQKEIERLERFMDTLKQAYGDEVPHYEEVL